MKSLKNRLKQEAERNTPDRYNEIMLEAEKNNLFAQKPTANGMSINKDGSLTLNANRKRIAMVGLAILSIILAIAIIVPLLFKNPLPLPTQTRFMRLGVEDFYGMGTVSAVSLLENSQDGGSVKRLSKRTINDNKTADDLNGAVRSFDRYFSAFDNFMYDGFANTVSEENTDAEFSDYRYKLTVNSVDDMGNSKSYVIYYSETLTTELDDDAFDSDDSDEEEEQSYVIYGATTVEGTLYRIEGHRSLEKDGTETESEMYLKVYKDGDENTFTEISEEISKEADENEIQYVYKTYTDGKLTDETVIEFEEEMENGQTEMVFVFDFKTASGREKFVLHAPDAKDNKYSVRYNSNGKEERFFVQKGVTNDGTLYREYVFSDESSIKIQ